MTINRKARTVSAMGLTILAIIFGLHATAGLAQRSNAKPLVIGKDLRGAMAHLKEGNNPLGEDHGFKTYAIIKGHRLVGYTSTDTAGHARQGRFEAPIGIAQGGSLMYQGAARGEPGGLPVGAGGFTPLPRADGSLSYSGNPCLWCVDSADANHCVRVLCLNQPLPK